jgi:hypothetical protein
MPESVRARYLEVRSWNRCRRHSGGVRYLKKEISPARVKAEPPMREAAASLEESVSLEESRLIYCGRGLPMAMRGSVSRSLYRILVSPEAIRPTANLYGFGLPEMIPAFPLPA